MADTPSAVSPLPPPPPRALCGRGKPLASSDGVVIVGTEVDDPLDGTFPGAGAARGVQAGVSTAARQALPPDSRNGLLILYDAALQGASARDTGSIGAGVEIAVEGTRKTSAWYLPFGPLGASGMFRGAVWRDDSHRSAIVAVGSSLLLLTLPSDVACAEWPTSGVHGSDQRPLFRLEAIAVGPLHALTEVLCMASAPPSTTHPCTTAVGRFDGSLQGWSCNSTHVQQAWAVNLTGGAVTAVCGCVGAAGGFWAITEGGLLHHVSAAGHVRCVMDTQVRTCHSPCPPTHTTPTAALNASTHAIPHTAQVAPVFALAPLSPDRALLGTGDGRLVLYCTDFTTDAPPLARIDPRIPECGCIEVSGGVVVVSGAEAVTVWSLQAESFDLSLAGHLSCRPAGPGVSGPTWGSLLDATDPSAFSVKASSLVSIPTLLPACEYRRRGKLEATLVPGEPHLVVSTTSSGQLRITDLTALPPPPPPTSAGGEVPWRTWVALPVVQAQLQGLVAAADS